NIKKSAISELRRLPDGLDYLQIQGLRAEAAQKLGAIRPENFGQAGRISGITPADITLLEIWLRKNSAQPLTLQ
ncbi:MAG: tRNA uridine 5-carboxymethylaminomethyl modification enzyme, partial [Chthoniobacter sp.]|nr:tRNA uridine 5-carboxymethylaminomethyl modification enzyme [Chthoniobacter sp.]